MTEIQFEPKWYVEKGRPALALKYVEAYNSWAEQARLVAELTDIGEVTPNAQAKLAYWEAQRAREMRIYRERRRKELIDERNREAIESARQERAEARAE